MRTGQDVLVHHEALAALREDAYRLFGRRLERLVDSVRIGERVCLLESRLDGAPRHGLVATVLDERDDLIAHGLRNL